MCDILSNSSTFFISPLCTSQIVLSPQSGRDPPPAKKVKTEMSSGKYNGLIPKDSHGRGSLHHYPPTTNVAEFPGCLLSKRPIADRQSGGKSPPAFASSLSNRQGENILFCSEEVTYQGETDEDENDFDEGGNFPISQEDEEAKNHPPPMLSSSSPPLTPPNFGPGISHHSVIASPSSYGCMNMDSGSSGSSNSAVMLSYSNGPWLCSPQLNFSPVETTPIHHHMGCSPLPASPLGCPVMYSPPPFTPNLFDRFD